MEIFTLVILVIAISLGFFLSSMMGFAAALIALPLLLYVQNIQEAVALISVFVFIFSIIKIYQLGAIMDKKVIAQMLIGIIGGLLIGIYLLKYGNPLLLKKLLGVFVLLYVGYSSIKQTQIKIFKKLGILFGFIGGIFSGMFATGGPLYVTYLHNKLKNVEVFRATVIGTMGISNFIRIILLTYNGLLPKEILINSIYILPFFFIAIYLGQKAYNRTNEKTFKKLILIILVILGIKLIIW